MIHAPGLFFSHHSAVGPLTVPLILVTSLLSSVGDTSEPIPGIVTAIIVLITVVFASGEGTLEMPLKRLEMVNGLQHVLMGARHREIGGQMVMHGVEVLADLVITETAQPAADILLG